MFKKLFYSKFSWVVVLILIAVFNILGSSMSSVKTDTPLGQLRDIFAALELVFTTVLIVYIVRGIINFFKKLTIRHE